MFLRRFHNGAATGWVSNQVVKNVRLIECRLLSFPRAQMCRGSYLLGSWNELGVGGSTGPGGRDDVRDFFSRRITIYQERSGRQL